MKETRRDRRGRQGEAPRFVLGCLFLLFLQPANLQTPPDGVCEGGGAERRRAAGRDSAAERAAMKAAGLREGDLYVFLYDDPDSGCQLNEALRWNLPEGVSIYHPAAQLAEGSVALADLGLLLENAVDIHLPVSALASLAQGAAYDLSRVERIFLHTYTQCADGAHDPATLSSSLWTRIDTPAALGLASLRPSVRLDTPYATAPEDEAAARDGRAYVYASDLSVTVRFEEPPHLQHSNARMRITCTGLNRSKAGGGIHIWTLKVGRSEPGVTSRCPPLLGTCHNCLDLTSDRTEWGVGREEGGGCAYSLEGGGWLYGLQRGHSGLWALEEEGGVTLVVTEMRRGGGAEVAVGRPFTLCGVARRGGLFREMRAECVPPGKLRGAEDSGGSSEERREERLAARRAAVLEGCGEVCDFSLAGEQQWLPGEMFDFVGKRVSCGGLWNNSALDAEIDEWPPPAFPPPLLLADYSRGGALNVERGTVYLDASWGENSEREWGREWIERLVDSFRDPTFFTSSYGDVDGFAFREGVRRAGVEGKSILVIGSSWPWIESLLLAEGAAHVTTLDYLPISSDHPRVTTLQPAEARRLYQAGRLGPFGGVVSYSSVEHSGLGRYGDGLNPWGDVQTISRAWCASSPGAFLLLGVPSGALGSSGGSCLGAAEGVEWNSGRVYGVRTWPHLVANWRAEWRTPTVGALDGQTPQCVAQPLVLLRWVAAPP